METLKQIADYLSVKPAHLKKALNNYVRSKAIYNDNWNVANLGTTFKACSVVRSVHSKTFGIMQEEKLTEKAFVENFNCYLDKEQKEHLKNIQDKF